MLCNVENQFITEQHAVVIKSHTCNLLSPRINQMSLTDVMNLNLLCEWGSTCVLSVATDAFYTLTGCKSN